MLCHARVIPPWCLLAAVFVVAILMRQFIAASTDVSWLLIAAERLVDGQRLYSDVIETNPPMAVLIYVPGVLIGRALGLRAEIITSGLVFAGVAVALTITSRMLKHSSILDGIWRWPLVVLAAAILTILPTQVLAQREHIAVIELLPALAAFAMRARRERPAVWAVVVAGLGLGLSLSFKPYFALAVLCCLAALALHARHWRIIVAPENVIAGIVLVLYAVGTRFFFPDYFTLIGPMVRDVYIPIGLPLMAMLGKPVMLLWGAALAAAILLKRKTIDTMQLVLVAASFGFGLVFILQRKGWPYHSYPMMAFALLAFGYAILSTVERDGTRNRVMTAALVVLLGGLFVQSMVWFNRAFDARSLQAAVARLGPHPTILAISGEAGVGHPLTRTLGGTWASRQQQSLFVAGYDKFLHKIESPNARTSAMMDSYVTRERTWLVEDFRKYRPTVILVDNLTDDWGAWMRTSPELVDLMRNYRLSETVMDIDIYSRCAD